MVRVGHLTHEDDRGNGRFRDSGKEAGHAHHHKCTGLGDHPGHQRMKEPGDYRRPGLTHDRWDPVVSQIGGVWDQLLDKGEDVWAAIPPEPMEKEVVRILPRARPKRNSVGS